MGNIGTWQLVIVALVILVLFGAKRLPEAARGLGRSLKIFKAETQGLTGSSDEPDEDRRPAPRAVEGPATTPPTTTPNQSAPDPAEPVADPRRDS